MVILCRWCCHLPSPGAHIAALSADATAWMWLLSLSRLKACWQQSRDLQGCSCDAWQMTVVALSHAALPSWNPQG